MIITNVLLFLDFEVNEPDELISYIDTNICGALGIFFWNDNIYTESGTYEYTTQTNNGCNSTVVLNLTISNSSSSSEDVISCDSYDWNSVTYTESGIYTFESTNEFGCTDIATLNLTIKNSSSSSENAIS